MSSVTRRQSLSVGAGLLTGAFGPRYRRGLAAPENVEIRMLSDVDGSKVGFDPIGILVKPGQRVRWHCVAGSHTATAYHPKNAGHSLRIPKAAEPWDSGYLLPDQTFEVTLKVEGVYDYFCTPHEMAGMVGRIVVGKPTGPGALPFDYFETLPGSRDWLSVPEPARKSFPPVSDVMAMRIIHPSDDRVGQ